MPGGIGVQENPTSERSHICYARNFQCLKGRMLRSGSHVSKISNLSKTMLPTYILNINSDGTSVAWVTEKLIKGFQQCAFSSVGGAATSFFPSTSGIWLGKTQDSLFGRSGEILERPRISMLQQKVCLKLLRLSNKGIRSQ